MMAKFPGRLGSAGFITAFLLSGSLLYAQAAARFDLAGPKVEVHVTRAGKTLPIASVPNLQAGDKLWLHPDLPPSQSVHYLLVAAFLRGTTNPPPEKWFIRIPTWDRKVREEGVTVTVPDEAQEAILFLAPETGGDFSTLRSTVRGRPGIFVRASQDLAEAGFEQARIEKYLASMRLVPPSDPKALLQHSNLLARTLNLKPNEECFQRPVDMQYNCLTQTGTQSLLDDGHGQTVVASLTSGANADFINAASYTGMAGAGMYSAYVGAVVDLVRVMSGLHTAHYQYIPAIAFPDGDSLNLRLNTPPSFNNPKSVIVIGLPAIRVSVPPPLRPADPREVNCLLKPSLVLPVEGAPLVFSTAFAHDLTLHINGTAQDTDIPLHADAFQGGLVLTAHASKRKVLPTPSDEPDQSSPSPAPSAPPTSQPAAPRNNGLTGTVSGFWGFDAFTGPTLQLQDTPGKDWKLSADDILIAGRENHLSLTASGTACIDTITLDNASGKQVKTQWKLADKPHLVDVTVPLQSFDPGDLHLSVRQFGESKADTVAAQTYSEPARLVSLQIHAGDTTATLTGTSLDQVQQLSLSGLIFTPVPSTSDSAASPTGGSNSTLQLALPPNTEAPKFKPGDKLTAGFTLKDGRNLTLPVVIAAPRPSVSLLSKSIGQTSGSPIRLANQDDLPVNQLLTFSLRSATPFPRTGQIEISNADESLHTILSVATGTLVLQNPHTILATLDPLKTFGTSAYGPLSLRAVSPDGIAGDWLPLVTLIRLPALKDLHCPPDAASACTLTGTDLYLIDKIATDPDFTTPTEVPEGFVGNTLLLPRPAKTGFYLRLRDDPTVANTVVMPILPLQATTATERKDAPQ
ncbi:MAG: hypothetical protein JWQ42_1254 [Edaphobacter sp.]|nr:hypothetical protein [Edaphobacter sp.]